MREILSLTRVRKSPGGELHATPESSLTANSFTCFLGIALLDCADPRKVIARAPVPVFQPEMPYEEADWGLKCVFPCANVVVGDEVFMYYGGGDIYVGLAKFSL